MVHIVIEEQELGPLMRPTSLPVEMEYRVQTVVVGVLDPLSGRESLLYLGPRNFVAEFQTEAARAL